MESTRGIEQRRAQEPGHEHIPVTKFIIDLTNPVEAENTESGAVSTIYDIGMSRKGGDASASYYGLSDLSRTEKLEIFIRSEDGTERVALPEDMLERVAAFIREDHAREEEADCSSFVHFVNGIRYEFGRFIPEKWEISDFDEQALVPGDSVMTAADPEHTDIAHFALYLGRGLYLSRFGENGKLTVAMMDEMKKAFSGEYVFHLRPKDAETVRSIEKRERMLTIEIEKGDLKRKMEAADSALAAMGDDEDLTGERLNLQLEKMRFMERMMSLLQEKIGLMRGSSREMRVPIIRNRLTEKNDNDDER